MRPLAFALLLLLAAPAALAQAPKPAAAAPPPAPVLLRAARLFDGRSDALRQGWGVLVQGERIQ